jgi:hypothetical protein
VSFDRPEVATPYRTCSFTISCQIFRFSRLGGSLVYSVSGAELLICRQLNQFIFLSITFLLFFKAVFYSSSSWRRSGDNVRGDGFEPGTAAPSN